MGVHAFFSRLMLRGISKSTFEQIDGQKVYRGEISDMELSQRHVSFDMLFVNVTKSDGTVQSSLFSELILRLNEVEDYTVEGKKFCFRTDCHGQFTITTQKS